MGRVDLIAVDGSPHSRYASQWYLDNMYRDGDRVILTHVVEYIAVGLSGITADADAILAQVNKRTDEIIVIAEEFMTARKIPTKLLGDKPGEVIVKIATDEAVSSIIMGTRGLGVIRQTLLGSVSEYVVHHANCPVTIVRQSEKTAS